MRTINDERASLPDISDTEPQRLSFLVAAAMEVDTDLKQELLEMRSTSDRCGACVTCSRVLCPGTKSGREYMRWRKGMDIVAGRLSLSEAAKR